MGELSGVKSVVFDQDGNTTGVSGGEISFHDTQMHLELNGTEIACPFQDIERVAVNQFPADLNQYFDNGLVIQWCRGENRLRAVIETKPGNLLSLLARVCALGTPDGELHVEQTVVPYNATPENTVQTQAATTPFAIDQRSKALTFESEEIQPIYPDTVTTAQQDTYEQNQTQYSAVTIQSFSSKETVETTVCFPDERYELLSDYLVSAVTLSETGGPIKVLLVDDEPGLAEIGKLQLTDAHDGLSIQHTTGTQQALELLQENGYECIVTDYAMPEGGASAVTEANKQQGVEAGVIVFSRKDRDNMAEEDIPVGIDLWITKEDEIEQYHRLGMAIKRLVAARRSSRKQVPQ